MFRYKLLIIVTLTRSSSFLFMVEFREFVFRRFVLDIVQELCLSIYINNMKDGFVEILNLHQDLL